MKSGRFAVVCLIGMCAFARAQAVDKAWLGVWHSLLDGQPGVTVTLADDSGQIGGTVVLNIVTRVDGESRVIASEPHVLVSPHLNDKTLTFELKRPDGSNRVMDFTMVLKAEGAATIHCTNCDGAPVVVLAKKW
jgi:hypothetical protein